MRGPFKPTQTPSDQHQEAWIVAADCEKLQCCAGGISVGISEERLREIVRELGSRPKHEKVRALIYSLLVDGIGAPSSEIQFERKLPEVHGRTDALLGRTVLEFKSDLRNETADAEEELTRYLGQR
jgi:hypothetical protein